MIPNLKKIKRLLNSKYFKIFIFLLVLYFTFILRAHSYDRTPGVGHLEEMLYAWSGIYLIETGVPVSWSTLDYPKSAEVFKGSVDLAGSAPFQSVTLYKPWLDEPPVFSLLLGYFGHLFNADRTDIIPSSYIRLPIIFISALTSIFIFLIARFVSGYWTGILSMLLYGTIPIIVFASRLAVPENLIALFFVIMIYLLLKFNEKLKFYYLIPIPFLAGIGGLSKPTGYFLLPLALYFVFHKLFSDHKNRVYMIKILTFLVVATIPFVAAFFWYGLYYDADIFWRILSIQGSRPAGFSSLGWLFSSPAYDIFTITDSWYVFSLLAAAYFIFAPQDKTKKFIVFALVYWIIIVMLSGGEADLLPWYRYPIFPLLAITGAWGLQLLVKRADFFATFFAAGFLLGTKFLLTNPFHKNVSSGDYRIIFSGLMLPSLLNTIFEKDWLKNLSRVLIIAIIIVGIYMNSVYIYNQFGIVCESITCPIGPSTWASTLYFPIFWRLLVY